MDTAPTSEVEDLFSEPTDKPSTSASLDSKPADAAEAKRISVRGCLGDHVGAVDAAGARAVLNHHIYFQDLLHVGGCDSVNPSVLPPGANGTMSLITRLG